METATATSYWRSNSTNKEECRDATKQEIKKAFRKLAIEYHPDRARQEDTTALFQYQPAYIGKLTRPTRSLIMTSLGKRTICTSANLIVLALRTITGTTRLSIYRKLTRS